MWRSGQRFHEILEEYGPSPSHHRLDTACLLLLAKEIHEAGQLAKDDGNIDSMPRVRSLPFYQRPNSSLQFFDVIVRGIISGCLNQHSQDDQGSV
jgi:hypothetical protein